MSDFGRELTRLMAERGAGVRQLARALYVNPGHLSNLRNGNANPSAELADALDRHLGGGGRLAALARTQAARAPRGPLRSPSRAVEALQVTMNDSAGNGRGIAGEALSELVGHYAHVVAVAPSAAVYDELLSARAFAGRLLTRGPARLRADLAVTAGW